jgi:release factor glutamine methyltransferase
MTVVEVIQRSSEFLARKGVESPRLQIELLLAHVLQMPRMKLYLNFDRIITDAEMATLRTFVKRRGEREPLQHILGSTSFCGVELKVTRDVLVPRHETELLAERAIEFLSTRLTRANAAPRDADRNSTVLDFGAGSGCLAILIALRCSGTKVHALDISEPALVVARHNAQALQMTHRIEFHLSDGFAALPRALRFDLIVSNPPYIPSADIEALQPEVRDHDPRVALDGGGDGLAFYRRLSTEAASWLNPGGTLMIELGDGQHAEVDRLFTSSGWTVESMERDYSGCERILIARAAV